jgi:virginiamycin B lyase
MKLSFRRSAAVLALALAACLAAIAPAAGAQPRVTSFPLPEFSGPNDVVTGPDGALWATDAIGLVWRITPTGRMKSFDVGGLPSAIASAHGALWIPDRSLDRIVKLTPGGETTSYPIPTEGAFPIDIVAGPDGALWFTEGRGDKIGRLTADGTMTEYAIPTAGAFAGDITAGPDGALWFVEQSTDKIARITTAGVVTEFALPEGTLPGGIAAGPDGALWFGERNTNRIARMTTAGVITAEYPLATEHANPTAITVGGDGALYIAQHSAGSIARMTLAGTVTREYGVRGIGPDTLTNGPDGAIWFADQNNGRVGRLDIGFDPPLTAAGTTFEARADKRFERTVATFSDADPNTRPRDYEVAISWGDGDRSRGTVHRTADGGFEVRGRHEYDRARTYRIVVRIDDGEGRGPDAVVESTALVRR